MKIQRQDIVIKMWGHEEPRSSDELTYVYKNANQEYQVIENGERMHKSVLKEKKYSVRYGIPTQAHAVKLQKEFRSRNLVDNFMMDITIRIRLTDPVVLIKSSIGDVEEFVKEETDSQVKLIAGKYDIDQAEELQKLFSDFTLDSLQDYGLQTSLKVTVDLSPEIIARIKRKEEQKRQIDDEREIKAKQLEEMMGSFDPVIIDKMKAFMSYEQLKNYLSNMFTENMDMVKQLTGRLHRGEIDVTEYMTIIRSTQNTNPVLAAHATAPAAQPELLTENTNPFKQPAGSGSSGNDTEDWS